ncbi:MAG: 2OG-Fe(II) oxygenase [Alphaproteobacteria bacterium]
MLDLDRFGAAPISHAPFDHVIVPGFIRPDALPALNADFPPIAKGGSYPPEVLRYGPAFAALIEEIEGEAMRKAFEAKFDIALEGKPVMITVRGHTRAKDGRIHTDSKTKLLTALLYFNDDWGAEGGRLRLLRSNGNLDDYAAEVPPDKGTLLAFRCTENAWHGHKPFIGPRRTIQVNWVTSAAVKQREIARHSFSALVKSIFSARA